MSFPFRLYLSRFLWSTWSTCSTRSLSEFAFHVKGVPNGRMVPIGRRWPCAEGFYWPGTLLLTVILWVFTFSFKSIYNCEDKRSIWRDLEYRKTYHKSVRTHIVCDARTKQNVKHGRDLIAADVCTILIHVFEVFYWANTSNQSNNWDHSLVKYLLRHSLFSLGCVSYRQIQGASMGSQWAPVVCSLVALHREHTYSMPFGQAIFSGKLFSSFRYVDNRLLLGPQQLTDRLRQTCFWNLDFYTSPILLEEVQGFDALGFNINPHQRTITSVLPWDTVIRTSAGFGPRSSMYTGLIARTRLILQNTFPRELQLPQVQDLLALHTLQEPRYRECIPQIISIARSFGHKWTRQQLTPFDWKEAVVAAFWFCAFHSNCNFATVATVQTFFCNIPPKTPGSQCDICFSVIDYIQFSSLVYVRCSTLYGSRYCNTLA